jgi:hypothetical protein
MALLAVRRDPRLEEFFLYHDMVFWVVWVLWVGVAFLFIDG